MSQDKDGITLVFNKCHVAAVSHHGYLSVTVYDFVQCMSVELNPATVWPASRSLIK